MIIAHTIDSHVAQLLINRNEHLHLFRVLLVGGSHLCVRVEIKQRT